MRTYTTAILLALCAASLGAADLAVVSPLQIDIGVAGYLADTIPYDSVGPDLFDELSIALSYRMPHILLQSSVAARNDATFTPEEPYTFGHYIDMKDAFVALEAGCFALTFGRYAHTDVVDSPYSLFISSKARPALTLDARYEDDRFFYESRWVQLNYLSAHYVFPTTLVRLDRGLNYKVYGLKFDSMRFGLQDSIVYTGRAFDAEYFLNPMFQYLQQLVRSGPGRPWTQDENSNSLNGFFFDIRRPAWYAYAQILVDDINMDFLGFWGKLPIPTKVAWSLGGFVELPFGRFRAYTAGATKYTFEASDASSSNYSMFPYEYAYYPLSEYELKDGTPMTLDYTDNYIGYKYGENSLSFMVGYTREFPRLLLDGTLEYVISGSKSPSNPWHEYYSNTQLGVETHGPFYLLDDEDLEHTLMSRVSAVFRFGHLEASARVALGGRWNNLELTEVVAGEPRIFRPTGADRLLYEVRLGVLWHFFN